MRKRRHLSAWGTADNFAVLAGSGITDTTPSVVVGDVGLSPTTGAAIGITSAEVTGTIYAVDAAGPGGSVNNPALLTAAKADLVTAYTNAAGQVPVTTVPTELGGTTKTAGTYNSAAGTFAVTGTLTLDAQGDPSAVFIFKTATTLTTAAASSVILTNGAQACNVFWQVGSSATLGTTSNFKGNIMALTAITDNGGSTVNGRLLARNAAVTLNNTNVVRSTCASAASGGGHLGTITVVKTVVNDNGGTKTVADFPLFVNGTAVASGVGGTYYAADMYTVTETTTPQYTQTFSGDCNASGQVSLSPNDVKICIVTNNDIGVPVALPPVPPIIDVVKVPSPLSLPVGPGLVNYTYTLRNIGTVPVTNITMVGDTCSPIVLFSGDANANARLELDETWVYRCSTTLAATHTNTVVATGWANGLSATDIASATVVVGVPIVPPLIHVTKVPSPLTLPWTGGMVTYTEKISNPGTVALNNVRLTDDKCGPMNYISGDLDTDNQLDTTETWTYTCRTNLSTTTTNTAIAIGEANGIVVRDFALVTVVVPSAPPLVPAAPTPPVPTVTPTLPKTGHGSNPNFLAWHAMFGAKSSSTTTVAAGVGEPMSLKISSIAVDAQIERVGLAAGGSMDIPRDPLHAAWYMSGPRPGEAGSAVIAGHLNWFNGVAGAFSNLHNVKVGDKVSVVDDKGARITFIVREIKKYDASADTTDVFSSSDGKAHLNLITCSGAWDKITNQYAERLVVFADKE